MQLLRWLAYRGAAICVATAARSVRVLVLAPGLPKLLTVRVQFMQSYSASSFSFLLGDGPEPEPTFDPLGARKPLLETEPDGVRYLHPATDQLSSAPTHRREAGAGWLTGSLRHGGGMPDGAPQWRGPR